MNDLRIVQCPNCQQQTQWSDDKPYRPFCSSRCKDADFIAWANEEQQIPGNPDYGDSAD